MPEDEVDLSRGLRGAWAQLHEHNYTNKVVLERLRVNMCVSPKFERGSVKLVRLMLCVFPWVTRVRTWRELRSFWWLHVLVLKVLARGS